MSSDEKAARQARPVMRSRFFILSERARIHPRYDLGARNKYRVMVKNGQSNHSDQSDAKPRVTRSLEFDKHAQRIQRTNN